MPYKDPQTRRAKKTGYQKKHYLNNKKYYKDKAKDNRILVKTQIADIKRNLKCVQCGENHPACLEFHHLDPNRKEFSIAKGVADMGIRKVLEEISKCIVLCANCHRKLHYNTAKRVPEYTEPVAS